MARDVVRPEHQPSVVAENTEPVRPLFVTETVETGGEAASEKEVMPEVPVQEPVVPSRRVAPDVYVGKKSRSVGWFLLVVVLLLTAVVLGWWLYLRGPGEDVQTSVSSPDQVNENSPTPSPSPLASASPVVELERASLAVQVLNGSGVTGEAARAKALLEEKGYKDVAVGNADKSTYAVTEVSLKKSASDFFEVLVDDLKSDYVVASGAGELADDGDYDAVIILGKK